MEISQGLSSSEARQRLQAHGYNELQGSKSKGVWHIALGVVKEPMFLLLISCGVLYMLLGDYTEGVILLSTIIIIIFITFYQYQKTEKALNALKRLSAPRVLVMRDKEEIRIPGREVVPGDIMILNEGDRIGADARVLRSQNLTVDESLLTGESLPVRKHNFTDESNAEGLVYSGALVTQGKGLCEVTFTGTNTQFGKIGKSLEGISESETLLQKEMRKLIRVLFLLGIGLSITVVLAFYFTSGNLIQSILTGLAAAMAILPEEFPVVFTIFMALGAWRLSKKNVLTRRPSAIETLGSATVLCSDKTGTITQNKMKVAAVFTHKEIIKVDDFTNHSAQVRSLINSAAFASDQASIDPMEKAIIHSFTELNSGTTSFPTLVKEYPLNKELLAMTIVRQTQAGYIASAKGSPEAIVKLCKLPDTEVQDYLRTVNELAEKGYRILGVASVKGLGAELPDHQSDFDFEFEGLLALEDPIRPEVPDAVRQCKQAGIRIIMITGDFPATAKSIGAQIGLQQNGRVLTGKEIQDLSFEELREAIKEVTICARVMPEQKLQIVKALKENGEIVAMTGDGVNDAPALKAADIGIAMGKKGTDVAREASALVLLDDNFASIVLAMRSGIRIFDNLQKAMSYIMAIHVPIVGLALLPAFFGQIPILLMPLHIVFMELLIDPSCSIAFEYEQEEKNIMSRSPRRTEEKFFGKNKIVWSVAKGILLLLMVLIVYLISAQEQHSEGEARAITFSALIIGNLALIVSSLSRTRSFFAVFTEKNYAVLIILVAAISVLLAVILVPVLADLFNFEFPGFLHLIPSLVGAAGILMFLELIKYFNNRRVINPIEINNTVKK